MTDLGLQAVVIIPDSKANPFKPARSPVEARRQGARDAFDSHQAVRVSDENAPATIARIRAESPDAEVLAIIGSDNLLRLHREKKAPSLPADGWIVVTREGDKNESELSTITELGGKKVHFIPPERLRFQYLSSTQVRGLESTIRENLPESIRRSGKIRLVSADASRSGDLVFLVTDTDGVPSGFDVASYFKKKDAGPRAHSVVFTAFS